MPGTTTDRVFIGDNLAWLGSAYAEPDAYDVIYIDPPYNTGSSFSYDDDRDDWDDWFEERLAGIRRVMRDDAALFVSIDDAKLIETCIACDRVLGRQNRVGIMITHQAMRSNARHINVVHEYVVAYAKDKRRLPRMSVRRIDTDDARVIRRLEASVSDALSAGASTEDAQGRLRKEIRAVLDDDPDALWVRNYRCVSDDGRVFFPKDLSVPGTPAPLDIDDIGMHLPALPTRRWSSEAKMRRLHADKRIAYLDGRPYEIQYIEESRNAIPSILPFYSRQGTEELKRLGCAGLFDTPKPVGLIELLFMSLAEGRQGMRVLDCFAGSGTTAQAAYEASGRLGIPVRWDLVQLDEPMAKGSRPERVARSLGIAPTIPEALLYRIGAYRKAAGVSRPYDVFRMGNDGTGTGDAGGDDMTGNAGGDAQTASPAR